MRITKVGIRTSVLFGIFLLTLAGCIFVSHEMEWGWQRETIEAVYSPSGRWRASLVISEPGSAISGLCSEVFLDRVGTSPLKWLPLRQVFISTLSDSPLDTEISWEKDGTLKIAYPRDVDVLKHLTSLGGVKIEYQSEQVDQPQIPASAAN